MIQFPTEFRTSLESYQGPLDLLLYLIKKDEVDILDIPVSRITAQFFTYLSVLQSIDPNACGDFLVMAAHLMEVKSRTLLPTEPKLEGEEMEDPRMELVRQLLEYKKYKERAMLLSDRLDRHSRRYRRPETALPEGLEPDESPLDLGSVTVWDLLSAFHRIQLAIGERGPHRVVHEQRPVEDYISSLEERAGRSPGRQFRFETVFEECRDIYDAIGFLLALLEMAKRRMLTFRQDEPFGIIEVVVFESPIEEPGPAPSSGGVEPPHSQTSATLVESDTPPSDA